MSTPAFLDVGLHDNVPASVYHADCCPSPSLSSSVLRTLLGKSIEHAALEHAKLGGKKRKPSAAMDLGSYVHAVMSGDTASCEVRDFPTFESKAAKEWAADAEARGMAPTLQKTVDATPPIVAALRDKAALGCDNDPFVDFGRSEVSAIWKEGDAYCRARYDRLVIDPNGYADVWDWKTTTDVSPEAIRRAIVKYGYHIQAAFYLRGLTAILPKYVGRTSFVFVFVETSPPYAVRRAVLSASFLEIGKREVNDGIAQWKHALASNQFTAPNRDTLTIEPPSYLEFDDEITASN